MQSLEQMTSLSKKELLVPKRSPKEIKKQRDSYSGGPLWLLYNAELRFTQAYESNPKSSDTMAWRHIYFHSLRLFKKNQIVKAKWNILPLTTIPGYSPIISSILTNRGITEKIEDFIESPLENLNPTIDGSNEAVNLILRAINKKVPITIYGDYDADGITGTALLFESLSRIGAKIDYYINNRQKSYAVDEHGIKEIASRGTPRLIITVDNGISSHEAVNLARKMKMAVIITDHHEITERPNAHVIVHPEKFNTRLSGVGVAFKVISNLYRKLSRNDVYDFLDLTAIGTIADVVPLLGENRILSKHGLKKMNESPRPAITALTQAMKINKINSETIAYKIAPVINALSRMNGTSDRAVEFLLTGNLKKATNEANYLINLNEKRKELVKFELTKIEEIISTEDRIFIIRLGTPEGIAGIIAGKLKEKYNRPAVVLSENGKYLKGSCRSVKGFNIIDALRNCDIVSCGGHPLAAGFILEKEKYNKFCQALFDQASKHSFGPPVINIDGELDKIDTDLIEEIESLEPYGEAFPAPLFLTRCAVKDAKEIGSNHFKVIDNGVDFIIWDAFKDIKCKELILIGNPSINEFSGKVQFIAKDYKPVL